MKIINNPAEETWKQLTERPQLELAFLESSVRNILNRVKKSGDDALRELTLQFDKVRITDLQVKEQEVTQAIKSLSPELMNAIRIAASNIEKFHAAQKRDVLTIETMPGVTC